MQHDGVQRLAAVRDDVAHSVRRLCSDDGEIAPMQGRLHARAVRGDVGGRTSESCRCERQPADDTERGADDGEGAPERTSGEAAPRSQEGLHRYTCDYCAITI